MNYEESTMLDIAKAAVKAGNAGHWPTVAGVLMDEVERLEGIVKSTGKMVDMAEIDPAIFKLPKGFSGNPRHRHHKR